MCFKLLAAVLYWQGLFMQKVALHQWRSGRSCTFKTRYHLVLTPKYRKKVFDDFLLNVVETVIRETAEQMKGLLIEFNGEENHIHLLVDIPPQVAVSAFVGKIKGKSSYVLRRDHMDRIRHALWGEHFWSPSYCCVTCGGAALEDIQKYIEEQNRPPSATRIKQMKNSGRPPRSRRPDA
jgi:putative transposase